MADPIYGMLGQSAPAAGVLTNIYTVPAARRATAKLIIGNRGGLLETFRLAVSPNGAAIANAHYLAYNMECLADDSLSSTPFTIGSADIVRVYSSGGNLSFSLSGIEEDGV